MANEATVRSSLQIKVGNLTYQSQPTAFLADVSSANGPTPGVVAATTTGVNVSLSALTTPGLCRVMNLDSTNYVILGVYDGASFFPLMELLPGESYVFRLYRNFGDEFVGTGTPSDVNTLRVMGVGGTCNVLVEAFEA